MRKRGRLVSVCLSVGLSVTFMYCVQMAEDIVKLLSRPGSAIILVFPPRAPIIPFFQSSWAEPVSQALRMIFVSHSVQHAPLAFSSSAVIPQIPGARRDRSNTYL